MGGSGISSSAFSAIAAGVRTELRADMMKGVLADAGLLDRNLAAGLDALGDAARDVTRAGLAVAKDDMIGTLIDALG